ncbi:unnamed protein product [Auanema sp. JU1783]|nr:unnamed protein product [Auanema sp. JU1783]
MSVLTETAAVSMEITELPRHESSAGPEPVHSLLRHVYSCLLAFFYILNLTVFIVCLWIVLMDGQSYLLDVTMSSEKKPPMKWVVWLGIGSGAISMLVCSFGILGLYGKVRYVLSVFIFGLAIVSFMQVAMGLTAREFRMNYNETTLSNFTYDLARRRYGVDRSAKMLMDKIQYYNDCCGAEQPEDYYFTEWFMKHRDTDEKAFVPLTCCKMKEESTFSDIKPLIATCTKVMYTAHIFQYLVKREGCSKIFSQKALQYPIYFEFLGLSMACYTVLVLLFVLLMIDKELYYSSLLS